MWVWNPRRLQPLMVWRWPCRTILRCWKVSRSLLMVSKRRLPLRVLCPAWRQKTWPVRRCHQSTTCWLVSSRVWPPYRLLVSLVRMQPKFSSVVREHGPTHHHWFRLMALNVKCGISTLMKLRASPYWRTLPLLPYSVFVVLMVLFWLPQNADRKVRPRFHSICRSLPWLRLRWLSKPVLTSMPPSTMPCVQTTARKATSHRACSTCFRVVQTPSASQVWSGQTIWWRMLLCSSNTTLIFPVVTRRWSTSSQQVCLHKTVSSRSLGVLMTTVISTSVLITVPIWISMLPRLPKSASISLVRWTSRPNLTRVRVPTRWFVKCTGLHHLAVQVLLTTNTLSPVHPMPTTMWTKFWSLRARQWVYCLSVLVRQWHMQWVSQVLITITTTSFRWTWCSTKNLTPSLKVCHWNWRVHTTVLIVYVRILLIVQLPIHRSIANMRWPMRMVITFRLEPKKSPTRMATYLLSPSMLGASVLTCVWAETILSLPSPILQIPRVVIGMWKDRWTITGPSGSIL